MYYKLFMVQNAGRGPEDRAADGGVQSEILLLQPKCCQVQDLVY